MGTAADVLQRSPSQCASVEAEATKLHNTASPISRIRSNTQAQDIVNNDFIDEFDGASSPAMSFALSPITSQASVDSETRIEEAIRRSLADQLPFANSETDAAHGHKNSVFCSQNKKTKVLSPMGSIARVLDWQDREDGLDLPEQKSVERELETRDGVISANARQHGRDRPIPFAGMIDCKQKEAKTKFPESSILAFAGNAQHNLKGKNKGGSRGVPQEVQVTRTMDPARDMVVVSAIPRKRKGRKNQSSYYEITSELRYLR